MSQSASPAASAAAAAAADELDETGLLNHSDTVARALRCWVDDQIERLQEEHDLFDEPQGDADRRRWALEVTEQQCHALGEIEHLRRVRSETARAWAEDRWADVGTLGARYRQHLPEAAAAAARRLRDVSHAYPKRGRALPPRARPDAALDDDPTAPWWVDPAAPVPGRSPATTNRQLWALLRELFPQASSGACTVAAHRIMREVLEPTLSPLDARELRSALASALGAARLAMDAHARAALVEHILTAVLVPLIDERNRLAAATADVRSLHTPVDRSGTCPACHVPSPCPTLRAAGHAAPMASGQV